MTSAKHSMTYLSATGVWICKECDWRTGAYQLDRAEAEILFRADPRHQDQDDA